MSVHRTLLVGGILAMAVSGILVYGNPQWSSWLYRFQAYVYPGFSKLPIPPGEDRVLYVYGPVPVPKHHTGPWRVWDEDGFLALDLDFEQDSIVGLVGSGTKFRRDGSRLEFDCGVAMRSRGIIALNKEFDPSGELLSITQMLMGFEEFTIYDRAAGIDNRHKYGHLSP